MKTASLFPSFLILLGPCVLSAGLTEHERTPAGNTGWSRDGKHILSETHSLSPEDKYYSLSSIGIGTDGAGAQLQVRIAHGVISEIRPCLVEVGDPRYSVRDLNLDGKADYIALHRESNGEIVLEAFIIVGDDIRPVPDRFLIKKEDRYQVQLPSLGDYITQESKKRD